MKRWVLMVLALLLVRALMLGGWWLVEDQRGRTDLEVVPPVAFGSASGAAPDLRYTRRDGSSGTLSAESETVVVHFWATWCLPCREELPSLLRWAERPGVELLAVSVDSTWDAVERFLDRPVPPTVVLADPDVARRWGAHGLPTTFMIERGQLTRVARGPVNWSEQELP